mmetsp:Transcript_72547/g.127901  ORF Transcript_72547/g.127901 Transcript_72547/m.127901 type:complete len:84 (-) Transcript_72547:176-427(-)
MEQNPSAKLYGQRRLFTEGPDLQSLSGLAEWADYSHAGGGESPPTARPGLNMPVTSTVTLNSSPTPLSLHLPPISALPRLDQD